MSQWTQRRNHLPPEQRYVAFREVKCVLAESSNYHPGYRTWLVEGYGSTESKAVADMERNVAEFMGDAQ